MISIEHKLKIKTFQFLVSNFAGNKTYGVDSYAIKRYGADTKPFTEDEIDDAVNAWITASHAVVKDIKSTTYTLNRHNNGYKDTVILVYTITYYIPKTAGNG